LRKVLAITLAAAAAAAAVLAMPALAATRSVKVGDNYFVRAKGVPTVTAKVGDTVKWNFTGKVAHTVTVKSGPVRFTSTAKSRGSFSKKITKAGTYKIYCQIHGAPDQSMVLKVS
jgi:plastocyanin